MSVLPPDASEQSPLLDPEDAVVLLQRLRRKEDNWVSWGQACQQLQKAGYTPQKIFEETGFEPIQQNQIIVAAQVYETIASLVTPEVLARFERTGSDTLYEFRVLTQSDRAAAANLTVEKGIDSEAARDVAKAMKEYSRLSTKPTGFTETAGDGIAYYYWKLARQQTDLQARSRLIAQGLRYAESETARKQIEQLLTDFTVTRSRPAPRLPFYRLESANEQPRILPVVGKLPLAIADLESVPFVELQGTFQLVTFSGTGAWISLPGWQVIFAADDPVAFLADSDRLPNADLEIVEEVLVVVDRGDRDWQDNSYFAVQQDGQIAIDWFEAAPDQPLLGRVVLVLRPKKVLDEGYNKDLWQIDE